MLKDSFQVNAYVKKRKKKKLISSFGIKPPIVFEENLYAPVLYLIHKMYSKISEKPNRGHNGLRLRIWI